MKRRSLLAIALAGSVPGGVAAACGDELHSPRRVEGARYVVAYVTVPAPIVAGEHFAIDFVVCARTAVAAPDSVRVDATMPQHRHGMNYRAEIVAMKNGRYRADGLLFHMSGRWDLTFDLTTVAGTERLTAMLQLE
ncbi:MAG TPA: FixH family protein [Casimicrobiaceae bacterium]|nr:FixH family protein [Casimicrobiaceae bacterium]